MQDLRRSPRYNLDKLNIRGELVLYPDPRAITIELDDISETGAKITLLSNLAEDQRRELDILIDGANRGDEIPVMLKLDSSRIPVLLVRMHGDGKYGVMVTESQFDQLAELARKGRRSFLRLIRLAQDEGSQEPETLDPADDEIVDVAQAENRVIPLTVESAPQEVAPPPAPQPAMNYETRLLTGIKNFLANYGGGGKQASQKKPFRENARYDTRPLDLRGSLILYPDPRVIELRIDDISELGAGITVLSPLADDQKSEIDILVKAAAEGKELPVMFKFMDIGIPVAIVSKISENRYGLLINTSNPKLNTLVAKGKKTFDDIIQRVKNKGAAEADIVEYQLLTAESLPTEIKEFFAGPDFPDIFISSSTKALINEIAVLNGKIQTRIEELELTLFFLNYLMGVRKNILLLAGSMMHYLRHQNPDTPVAALFNTALNNLFDDKRIFGGREYVTFQRVLIKDYLEPKMTHFRNLPADNAYVKKINLAFHSFTGGIAFLEKLIRHVCPYYAETWLPQDSPVRQYVEANEESFRQTLYRWIRVSLTTMYNADNTFVDTGFKHALYEYMLRKRSGQITAQEAAQLFNGETSADYTDIRERFLRLICSAADSDVMAKWKEFEYYLKKVDKNGHMKGDINILKYSPKDLLVRFCWSIIKTLIVFTEPQKAAAKSFFQHHNVKAIDELGGVIVLPPAGIAALKGYIQSHYRARTVRLEEYFTVVDLHEMYSGKFLDENGSNKISVFKTFVDTLNPPRARDAVLNKVIFSPEWSVLYILNAPRRDFDPLVGESDREFEEIIRRHMFTKVTTA